MYKEDMCMYIEYSNLNPNMIKLNLVLLSKKPI